MGDRDGLESVEGLEILLAELLHEIEGAETTLEHLRAVASAVQQQIRKDRAAGFPRPHNLSRMGALCYTCGATKDLDGICPGT